MPNGSTVARKGKEADGGRCVPVYVHARVCMYIKRKLDRDSGEEEGGKRDYGDQRPVMIEIEWGTGGSNRKSGRAGRRKNGWRGQGRMART